MNQPVDNYLQILRLFPSEDNGSGLGSNEILKLTGKTDKQQVYHDIKALISAKIIYTKKNKRAGYKQPKYLTDTGKKIRDFAEDLDKYRNSCTAFRNKISILLSCIEDNGKIKRFQDLVTVDDIDINSKRKDYEKLVNYTGQLVHPIAVINAILYRYCKLLTEFDEKSVKTILNQIVTEAINSELQEMVRNNKMVDQTLANLYKNCGNNEINENEFNAYKIQNIYDSALRGTYLDVLVNSWSTNVLDFNYLKDEFKEMAKMSLRFLPMPSEKVAEHIELARKVAVMRSRDEHVQTIISIFEEGYSNG